MHSRKPVASARHAIGRVIELDIEAMGHGGRGLGWHEGRAVFVPYTLPGETVRARITGQRGGALFAQGQKLLAASGDRAAPHCVHFGQGGCWGCQWQHIASDVPHLLKHDQIVEQLSRIGKVPEQLLAGVMRPPLPAALPWQYNHSLQLAPVPGGGWGMQREDGSIESLVECPVTQPQLLEVLAQVDMRFRHAKGMTIRRGSDGRVMLILRVDAEHAPQLQTDLPLSVNLLLPDGEPVNLIGDSSSHFHIRGRDFRVTAGASIRKNLSGIEQLVGAVERALALRGGEAVLDLYAGVGIFSAFIARRASLVTMVESYPPAASDAEANLQGLDNIDIIEGAVEELLEKWAAAGPRYDAALVDPPSRGLSAAALAGLAALELQCLVYISSKATSLARDCRQLLQAGYRLQAVQSIDLAPQAYYTCAVATFRR